jgi:hypothetical protein
MARLRLAPNATFRFSANGDIEIVYGLHKQFTAAREDQALLAAFAAPRTVEEAHAIAGGDAERFAQAVSRYLDAGVLVGEAAPSEQPGIRAYLREDLFADPALYETIKREIRTGHLFILRDAFREDFAERVWRCLHQFEGWESFRAFKHPYFSSVGQGIFDRGRFPSDVLECERVFNAPSTRALMADLTGLPCDSDLIFDPTLYLAGDFLAPHSDVNEGRSMSFLWQLTKGWQPNWGGHFAWFSPPVNLIPTFNTLILFRVTAEGYHLVTPVSPHACEKRLTLSGWWTSTSGAVKRSEEIGEWYRGPVRAAGGKLFFVG